MKYNVTTQMLSDIKADCFCLPFFKDGTLSKTGHQFDQLCGSRLSGAIKKFNFKGEAGAVFMLPVEGLNVSRILLVGLDDSTKVTADTCRKAATSIATSINGTNIKHLLLDFTDVPLEGEAASLISKIMIEAIETSRYTFEHFKSKKSPKPELTKVDFYCNEAEQESHLQAISIAVALAKGVALCKDLGNQPSNVCTPSYLADEANKLSHTYKKLSVNVLEEKDIEALGMGAFLSVTKGSSEPGKMIIIEYKGAKKDEAPHVLVGKGITFDSGGISLKPGPQMDEMKFDMCGAASVLGTLTAAAELKLPLNIIGVIAAAENMPAGNASKPGDIVTTASGQTVEILNTDAEGRLVLCDALTYVERFKPASVVDIATLTGACIIALGNCASAVMSNDDNLAEALLKAGKEANDKAWQLPIWDDYQKQLDSPFADMQNIGGKEAGSITAACFLSRFAKKYKWAHLDIAGTAWVSGGKNKGATGRPVPLLLQYLLHQASL